MNICNFAIDSLSFLALQNGFGTADIKSKCETEAPIASLTIQEQKATYECESASKFILKMRYTSQVRHLDQINVSLRINRQPATLYTVSDTPEEGVWEYRIISLRCGKNEFEFEDDSTLVQIRELILYPFL